MRWIQNIILRLENFYFYLWCKLETWKVLKSIYSERNTFSRFFQNILKYQSDAKLIFTQAVGLCKDQWPKIDICDLYSWNVCTFFRYYPHFIFYTFYLHSIEKIKSRKKIFSKDESEWFKMNGLHRDHPPPWLIFTPASEEVKFCN